MDYTPFKLKSDYTPTGDQPEAIARLCEGINRGERMQTLLGVTGSGKTFTMANVIARCNRPTLILEPNKTLAAQVCSEMREFFPDNAVGYFVSYYDYYQPEAYIPGKDMYIEKDALINDDIDKLRHSATSSLFERRDVIIVSSVSCIYSLGDPEEYEATVSKVSPAGLFVDLPALAIGGLVHISTLSRQFVRHDRRCEALVAGRKRWALGDTVRVRVARVDFQARRLDFVLA